MNRFFDLPDTHWSSLSDCLHLYALPSTGDTIRSGSAAALNALMGIEGLGVQPAEYLHVTLQRFDAFQAELVNSGWQTLLKLIPEALTTVSPIHLDFREPVPMSHAVESVGDATPEWHELLRTIQDVAHESGLQGTLTPAPSAPHFTLAYAARRVPDSPVQRVLDTTAAQTEMLLAEVCLVSVTQDPVAGVFSFDILQRWPLGGRSKARSSRTKEAAG